MFLICPKFESFCNYLKILSSNYKIRIPPLTINSLPLNKGETKKSEDKQPSLSTPFCIHAFCRENSRNFPGIPTLSFFPLHPFSLPLSPHFFSLWSRFLAASICSGNSEFPYVFGNFGLLAFEFFFLYVRRLGFFLSLMVMVLLLLDFSKCVAMTAG